MAKSGSMQPGFVLRHSSISIDGAADDLTETVVGVNAYYDAHNLKTQLQVRNIDIGSDDATSIDLLFTLVF